jgi:hypothetical protein
MQTSLIAPMIIPAPEPDLTQIICPQKLHCPIPSTNAHSAFQSTTSDNNIWEQFELIHSWTGI